MAQYRIVNTDNFDGDYPNEKFVENLPLMYSKERADAICDVINKGLSECHARWFKVVEMPYELQPGFEP